MDTIFILFAKYLFILPIIIISVYFLRQPKTDWKRMAFFGLASAVLAYIIAKISGHFYYDPRPFVIGHFTPLIAHSPNNGFPSDHTLLAAAIASIGTYWNKKLGVYLWILAAVVAFSRVYVGVHHTIDVLGSVIIAVIATIVISKIFKKKKIQNIA